jgi:6-phosphogluconolactonase
MQRQQSPHVHMAVYSVHGEAVYATDLGTDELLVYPFSGGVLDKAKSKHLPLQPGSGPRHVVLHPKKRMGYVLQELSGSITAVRLPESQMPEAIQTIQADTLSALPGSADIHFHPSGKFLYASNRADANTISIFSVHPKTQKLSLVAIVSTQGKKPRNFCIHPSGRFMLVANQDTNNIAVFSIDPSSGIPVFTGTQLEVPSPVCLVFGTHFIR